MGHPCCADRSDGHCQIDLSHGRDRYCWKHANQSAQCAVVGCNNLAAPRFVTCNDTVHRTWEQSRRNRGAAYRVLKRRHKAAWAKHKEPLVTSITPSVIPDLIPSSESSKESPADYAPPAPPPPAPPPPISYVPPPDPTTDEADEDEDEEDGDISHLPAVLADEEILKGIIYRRWSHNEQLVVSPCGIIKGRATFYGAEGQDGVVVRRLLSLSFTSGLVDVPLA